MTHDDVLNLKPVQATGDIKDDSEKDTDDLIKTENSNSSIPKQKSEAKTREKLILVKQTLEKIQNDLNRAFKILAGADTTFARSSDFSREASKIGKITQEGEARVIEGVFDGQNMIGPDGKQYSVPANYASKSKLVEGDILKLTIQFNGTFVYKQIGPGERERLKGILIKDEESGEFLVLADAKKYKVLLASITYFKGQEGDEVAILVPKEKNSTWAAVENLIKKSQTLDIPKHNSNSSNLNIPTDSVIDDLGL